MTNKKCCMKTSWTVKKCRSQWNADVPLLRLFSRRCRRPSTATSVWWSPSTWAAVTSCGATAPSCRSSRRLSPQPITAGRRPAAAWRAGRGGCTLRSCSVRWDIYIRDKRVIWLQHLNKRSSETSSGCDLWPLCSSSSAGVPRDAALSAAVARSGREQTERRERQRPVDGAARPDGAPRHTDGENTDHRQETSLRLDFQHNLLCETILSAYLFAVSWWWN